MAGKQTRVNILVEGQTEESFVRTMLAPHLANFQVWMKPRIIQTSKGHKGGVASYGKLRHQVRQWCQQDPTARVTTLFDVYGLPADFPGFANWNANQPTQPQVEMLEANMRTDIGQDNLIPYLQLHEYEALLFSDLSAFAYADVPPKTIAKWQAELAEFANPEELNNAPQTAPSKRLIKHWPNYANAKPHYGVLIAQKIGLPVIRASCPRFDAWVRCMESL